METGHWLFAFSDLLISEVHGRCHELRRQDTRVSVLVEGGQDGVIGVDN
jgi:hypothetical protein